MPVLPSADVQRSITTQPRCSTSIALRPTSWPAASFTIQLPAQKSNSRYAPDSHGETACAGADDVAVVGEVCVCAATGISIATSCISDATRMTFS
jgi:hypothetical protein